MSRMAVGITAAVCLSLVGYRLASSVASPVMAMAVSSVWLPFPLVIAADSRAWLMPTPMARYIPHTTIFAVEFSRKSELYINTLKIAPQWGGMRAYYVAFNYSEPAVLPVVITVKKETVYLGIAGVKRKTTGILYITHPQSSALCVALDPVAVTCRKGISVVSSDDGHNVFRIE